MTDNTENFEGWPVTANCKPNYSFGHNLRWKDYVETQWHIDPSRPHRVLFHFGDERETFLKVFGSSQNNYNAKQKRKDRHITDYYQVILDDARHGSHKNPKANSDRKPFYEFQFYLGNRKSHCPDEIADRILSLYIQKRMPKRFPNFIFTSVVMHNDEYSFDRKGNRVESPLHYQAVGIFVAHALNDEEKKEEKKYREKCKEEKKAELAAKGIEWDEEKWKQKDWRKAMIARWGKALERGMELQCSMSAACNEMGFFTEKGKGTAQQQFEEAVRHDLMDFCEEMGIKVNRKKGYKHSHQDKDIYKAEQDNMELEAELAETKAVLEAKELELQNRKDDFDYTIEHLDEIEQNLTNIKIDLQLQQERLDADTKKIKEQEVNLVQKEKVLEEKLRTQISKDEELARKEKSLNAREAQIAETENNQTERENRIRQGEAPLKKMEEELIKWELDIEKRKSEILKRENEAIRLFKESKEHEQSATEKEANANKMLETSEQNKHKAESAKLDAENARKETEKLLLQNQNLVESFNSEYIEKSQKIESWNEAAEEIDNSDFWMKSAFTEYKANPSKENALQTLFKKVKNGVAAAIVKVKQTYDAKIKEMNEQLFGHKRIYHTENKIVCEYSYGESDYADMLRDTPVSDIEAAISETRKKGKLTFAEAAATCEGLSFYERFFTKAKTLTHEREIELSKERKRSGITR